MEKKRCIWAGKEKIYIDYHDKEWGVPVRDDKKQFEFLTLEGFQAGLSWITILKKRENFRKAFDDFDFEKIALYNENKIRSLLEDKGIVRNQLKIRAAVTNARAFIQVRKEFGSFTKYIWGFTDNKTLNGMRKNHSEIPANTELSDKISKDLKKRGFKFVGSTVVYSHLQATGIINDHIIDCFRHSELS